MKILYLTPWYPYPPDNGSKLRIYHLVRGLAERHAVTLISASNQPDRDRNDPVMRALCNVVQLVPMKRFDPGSLRAVLGFLSRKPRSVVDTFSKETAERIDNTLAGAGYDVVIASQLKSAMYHHHFGSTPALFDELELGFHYDRYVQTSSPWRRFRLFLMWQKQLRWLSGILPDFGACTVASHHEHALVNQFLPSYPAFNVVPNSVDVDEYATVSAPLQGNLLVFTGSFTFGPNYEAMRWFVGHVLPEIRAHVPDVRLEITGNHADLPLPGGEQVTRTGYVQDVRPYVARAWASVAPVHSGGGTRLKILEAMALHTPVISTSKGAEGLDVEDGRHILIADNPTDFARATVRLLGDLELRNSLIDEAYQLVSQKYNWKTVLPRFLDLVERVSTDQ